MVAGCCSEFINVFHMTRPGSHDISTMPSFVDMCRSSHASATCACEPLIGFTRYACGSSIYPLRRDLHVIDPFTGALLLPPPRTYHSGSKCRADLKTMGALMKTSSHCSANHPTTIIIITVTFLNERILNCCDASPAGAERSENSFSVIP